MFSRGMASEQELRATSWEHFTPGLLEERTMREDSLASSHERSGILAAIPDASPSKESAGQSIGGLPPHMPIGDVSPCDDVLRGLRATPTHEAKVHRLPTDSCRVGDFGSLGILVKVLDGYVLSYFF